MGIFSIVLIVFFVIICLLLMVMVLLQDGQGNTVGGIFSGGSSSTFGSESGNVVTRLTTILGILFLGITFFLSWQNKSSFDDKEFLKSLENDSIQKEVKPSPFWESSSQEDISANDKTH